MHPFAQTNIQLLNQLRREGYPAQDLAVVVASYEQVMVLMTGQFRASGKTFIAHLVGTASILGSLRVPPPLLAAGLLHAVYLAGDFGDGTAGVTDAKRQRVRAAVGEDVEDYVSRYTALPWNTPAIRTLSGALEGMAARERDVVLLRLANELEEYLDLGILYGGEARRVQTAGERRRRLMIEMAEKLGFPGLAAEFQRAFEELAAANIPPESRRPDPKNASSLIAPLSYQRLKDALARRLGSAPETKQSPPHENE